ncbi:MAG: hypothetical protein M5U28_56500 [Sandaracinaceae bacterium]|nr:hypothetical protein [Sandaracinaceae bacterium]
MAPGPSSAAPPKGTSAAQTSAIPISPTSFSTTTAAALLPMAPLAVPASQMRQPSRPAVEG